MGARHGPSARSWQSTSMPSTPGCLRKILRILYTRHTTNDTVRSITGCLPVSEKDKSFRLRFFRHLARSTPEEDHHRVIAAALRPPPDWQRPPGRPRSTWLTVINEDIQPQNFGIHTAWRKAKDRDTWHQVVSTATLCQEFATKKKLGLQTAQFLCQELISYHYWPCCSSSCRSSSSSSWGRPLQKNPRLHRFQSDRDEILQECSLNKYADFQFHLTLSRRQLWHHFKQKSDAIWWVYMRRVSNAYALR